MLYTLQKGDVVSKPVAAEWAKANLSKKWTGLIERAWTGRQTPNLNARSEDISETLDLIRYVLEYSAQINNHKDQV